ncbi:hypothetical protein AB0H73_02335 [Streptomyces olivoreticuli]|uniref:hypothetical protein n=1 Tax=Streptomyces olivoreticuli TaxID=68246 RepID=UPI0013C35198|nr:hypothetical protein [Streptomyces olivoreticuli]
MIDIRTVTGSTRCLECSKIILARATARREGRFRAAESLDQVLGRHAKSAHS